MSSRRLLAGKVVLVTGVTAGIGRATVRRLVAAGALVHGCARDEQRLRAVATELPALRVARCDVTDAADRAALVDGVLAAHGRVDVLVNNAGVGYLGAVVDMTEHDVARMVDTNLTAPLDLTRRVLPGMVERGSGDVLMLSSSAAWVSAPPLTAYAATKRALDGFVEGLRREVTAKGVRVHSVNPGAVATEFHARALGLHPAEDDPEVRLSPGVSADVVARAVRDQLEHGRGRTVAVPAYAALLRLASATPVSPLVDLVVRRNADQLADAGRSLADRRTGRSPARR